MALRHVHTENSSQGKEGMASYAADEAAELLQHWMFGFVMSVIWLTPNPDRLRAPRVVRSLSIQLVVSAVVDLNQERGTISLKPERRNQKEGWWDEPFRFKTARRVATTALTSTLTSANIVHMDVRMGAASRRSCLRFGTRDRCGSGLGVPRRRAR